jgi:hypothetical protein
MCLLRNRGTWRPAMATQSTPTIASTCSPSAPTARVIGLSDGSGAQDSLAVRPNGLVVDRVHLHAHGQSTRRWRRLNSATGTGTIATFFPASRCVGHAHPGASVFRSLRNSQPVCSHRGIADAWSLYCTGGNRTRFLNAASCVASERDFVFVECGNTIATFGRVSLIEGRAYR